MDDFNALENSIKAALVSTIRGANALGSEDLPFHRSLDPSVGPVLDRQNARLLGLAERLVGAATANTEIVRPPQLHDSETVDGNWRSVVDVVDSLLERADTALDEFTGAVKRLTPDAEQATKQVAPRPSRIAAALKNQELDKPQLLFEHVPTNDESGPFKPLLLSKPYASVPLETEPVGEAYAHPYQHEIEEYQYPSWVYTQSEPLMYKPFESTTASLVDTEEALMQMLEELKQARQIAIDLEHHDTRSYIGIVCLMQISTRDKDWIIDTLKPWRRRLQCLNEVFANPAIIKVLHGAFMDVVWLQRDLGLYLVGLFDTHYAARALGYQGGSLAFLLKHFIGFDAQKQYQLADWRIRPLPKELFEYARSDTHFLLYIFDCMRNELIQRSDFSKPDHESDKLWDVLQKSSECTLQRYEHPIYDAELGQGAAGWYKLISRESANLNREQFSVFRALHKWRDGAARQQDDSVHYIMPHHLLFKLSQAMPSTRAGVMGITPTTQTVRLRADETVGVIAEAKAAGKEGPELQDVLNAVEPRNSRINVSQSASNSRPAPTPEVRVSALAIAPISGLPLRTSTSTFWGRAFESSAWSRTRSASTSSNLLLSVPLPPLTAEIFAESAAVGEVDNEPSTPTVRQDLREENDDVFVLKDDSKKRKRADLLETLDGMAANLDEVAVGVETDRQQRGKAERKAAKKEAKKVTKANGDTQSVNGEDEAAFDYASAPSILNPPREFKEKAKERKKKEKQLHPYAKALDAPKGLPRVQKEKAGRSMTYRSND